MTNQEWFKNLDTYTFLRGLNLNIGMCIFDAIPSCVKPPCESYSVCAMCIAEWLKQERKESEEGG